MRLKLSALCILTLALVSCGKEGKKTPTADGNVEQNITSQRSDGETDSAYAAKLARIGEILVNNPVGLVHAHDMFEKALLLDPQNNKALLYSAFTGIAMTMEGYIDRTGQLSNVGNGNFNLVQATIDFYKYPEFEKFLKAKSTQSKLETSHKIKRFAQTEVLEAMEKGMIKLGQIKGNVNVILTQLKTKNRKVEYNCEQVAADGYDYTQCDVKSEMTKLEALQAKTVTIDEKDAKVLAGALKFYAAQLKIASAWSWEGHDEMMKEIQAKEEALNRSLTDQEEYEIAVNYPKLLTLESDHRLNEVVSDLESILAGAMDFAALNNEFCDNEIRKDNLLKIICVSDKDQEDMEEISGYLSGPKELPLIMHDGGKTTTILVDLPAFLSNPVQDLKTVILPQSFNEDGSGNYTQEPDLNGLFPNLDLLEKIKLVESSR